MNSLSDFVMFERSTDRGWHNPSGTSYDSRGGLLEQVSRVLATQRQEKLPLNINYLLKQNSVTMIYAMYL